MKMRKLWALLLAVVMVCGLFAGCQKDANPSTAPSTEPNTTSTEPSTEPSEEPLEVTWNNEIIIGDTTEPTGDIKAYWANNGADAAVNGFTGLSTLDLTYDTAEYVIDATVVKDWNVVTNDDGSKTVTFELNPELKWSNGDPITAKDFVRAQLLFSTPAIVESGAYGDNGYYNVGFEEFNAGETAVFSGVRLLSDTSFAVTIDGQWFPDFFEIRYYGFGPEHSGWLPSNYDIADDGEGAYFTKDGEQVILNADELANIGSTIENWRYNMDAFSGPYMRTAYDTSSMAYTLEINPYFLGNYEGQKPSIAKIIYKGVKQTTMMDELRTGSVTFIKQTADAEETGTGLSMYDEGLVNYATYDRNGYGALYFKCNVGPTQFKEVRHAVGYLLDRNDFCRAFTGGFGMVVNGPYGSGMWMTKQGAEELNSRLNGYNYSVDSAIAELEAGGWTLNAEGGAYESGLRYKEVTAEQAGTGEKQYPGCVTLSDGRILMPLHINWASSEGNSVSDLLATKLANGAGTAEAGMEIEQAVMTFNEMYYEHYNNSDESYYCAFNLATNFSSPAYDQRTSTEKGHPYNVLNIDNDKLHQLAVDMLLVEAGDNDTFLELWLDFEEEWNDYLPALPLYSNTYYDFFTPHLKNYTVNSAYIGTGALLYAYIEGYEAE